MQTSEGIFPYSFPSLDTSQCRLGRGLLQSHPRDREYPQSSSFEIVFCKCNFMLLRPRDQNTIQKGKDAFGLMVSEVPTYHSGRGKEWRPITSYWSRKKRWV